MESGQALADLVREVRLRAEGMNNHLNELTGIGLQQTDIDEGKAYANRLEQLDAEQEALKAQLKAKTAEVQETTEAARHWRNNVSNRIKLAMAQNLWVEFGITADR